MPTFAFSGGVTTVPGYGQKDHFYFIGTFTSGDKWTVGFTATSEGDFTLGAGRIAGISPVALRTVANRVFMAAGSSTYFCDNVDPVNGSGPIEWEEQGAGAGQIPYISQYGLQDTVIGFASQQGRLAIFGRYSIQIWAIDSDPANFSRIQILTNLGCRSALTIQQLGDMDALFLDDSGIRSLRTKEINLNADPVDIGSAIDSLVTAKSSYFSTACAIVEPVSKRYWCFIQDTIYVLSYFRQNKIVAWSTYLPTYTTSTNVDLSAQSYNSSGLLSLSSFLTNGHTYLWVPDGHETSLNINGVAFTSTKAFLYTTGDAIIARGTPLGTCTATLTDYTPATTFTPTKFIVYNGLIYIRTSDGNLLHYTEASYDNCVATVTTPYMDDQRPGESKYAQAIDVAMSGAWSVQVSTDPVADTYQESYASGDPVTPSMKVDSTFPYERVPYSGVGTHFSFKAVSSSTSFAKATLGGLVFHYNRGGQP